MRVILLQDIPKVGKKYEVKEVADGFGRNVLLKSGKVKLADANTIREVEGLKKRKEAEQLETAKEFEVLAEKLKDLSLVMEAKASKDGALFAGIHKDEVKEALKKQLGINIDESLLVLEKPIKHTGTFEVKIKSGSPVANRLETSLKIEVITL